MNPTPYPDLNKVLQELVTSMTNALGETLIGVCLQGSFAIGDFDRHSDVDFIVAIERELSAGQVGALQVMHERVYHLEGEWAQHLEGSYFPKDVLKDYTKVGRDLRYLDHGSRSLERSDHCNSVVVRWTVREYGVPLIGPNPRTLVDPIPVEALRREIRATMRDWGREVLEHPDRFRNRFYQSFIVLSYCRMLHDFRAGRIGSKREGAEWPKERLDPSWRDLIDGTWAGRPNPSVSIRQSPDPAAFERTLEFVEYVIEEAGKADDLTT